MKLITIQLYEVTARRREKSYFLCGFLHRLTLELPQNVHKNNFKFSYENIFMISFRNITDFVVANETVCKIL